MTDANGNYNFSGCSAGQTTSSSSSPLTAPVLSTANVGDDAFDSDAGADGFTGCYADLGRENNTTVDAGF
ncbi:MAG: hypothetical protein KF710_01830 [Rhodocyclaceae bacterium]|nr:hypothetical protein [Rhodocyclaceae bacterium]